jgi:hypothetical protein
MSSFFTVCAVLGGGILILQFLLGLFGLGGGHDVGHLGAGHAGLDANASGAHGGELGEHEEPAEAGLNLLSVRALTAGLAFFGLAGLATVSAGWPAILALPAAAVAGFLAMLFVAVTMRWLLRLESDGSPRIANAIGAEATVYIPIPAHASAPGKVMFALQGRTVEYDAVTTGSSLPTGASVIIVDVRDDNVLEVVETPTLSPEEP